MATRKQIVVVDEDILGPTRVYVENCLQIMKLTRSPEAVEVIVQEVAQYAAKIKELRAKAS